MKTIEVARCTVVLLAVLLCSCSSTPEKPQSVTETAAPTAPPAAPEFGVLAVTPNSGGARQQVFTVRLQRNPGAAAPALVGLLVNKEVSGVDACYLFHDFGTKHNLLVNDTGIRSREIGAAVSVGNKQCELLADQSIATVAEDAVSVNFHVRFKPGFAGPKRLFAVAQDANGAGPALRPIGQFKVE